MYSGERGAWPPPPLSLPPPPTMHRGHPRSQPLPRPPAAPRRPPAPLTSVDLLLQVLLKQRQICGTQAAWADALAPPATRAPSHPQAGPPLPARTARAQRAPTPRLGLPPPPAARSRTGEEGVPPREALPEPGRGRGGGRRREAGRGRGVLPTRHLAAAPAGRRAASSPRRGSEGAAGPEGGRGRARRGPGPGPGDGVSRVPGRGAQGAGGRRKAGGGVWAGHAAPASARQSRARSHTARPRRAPRPSH